MTKRPRQLPLFFALALCGLLTACAPSLITETTSAYDGSKHRKLPPLAGTQSATSSGIEPFGLGLYAIDDRHFLMVRVFDIVGIESVGIDIDGRKFEYYTDDSEEFDIDGYGGQSTQMFRVPHNVLLSMTEGKRVIVQVRTSRGFLEGDFTASGCDKSLSWCSYFRKFLTQ